MAKKSAALILTLLILTAVGPALAEEMAREGSATIRAYWVVTLTPLPMSKELIQMNYDGYGVVVSDTGKGLLHNATAKVVGGMLISKGAYEDDSGLVIYTRPDGEKIFATFKGSGQMGKSAEGAGTIVGGTGKFEGITGTINYNRYQLRPPADGVSASIMVAKEIWKLPDKK